jgi:phosphosulfolactate synthase (CoM biosynthesis protein A)
MIKVRQHLTTRGDWVDYHGWNWAALPLHEKRIINRQVDREEERTP